MVQALVPLKNLFQAKTRLAGLMGPLERRALAQAMAEDVLTVLCAHPRVKQVTLVSEDPGARRLAGNYGAAHLADQDLGCCGLNQIIEAAVDQLRRDPGETIVVLHGDLPLLSVADISAALDCQQQSGGLVIGCDRYRRGSNLLAFDRLAQPAFHFGADSCAAHSREAGEAGIPVQTLYRRGIAFDVDEAPDMVELMTCLDSAGDRIGKLLRGSELGNRISQALRDRPRDPQDDGLHRE